MASCGRLLYQRSDNTIHNTAIKIKTVSSLQLHFLPVGFSSRGFCSRGVAAYAVKGLTPAAMCVKNISSLSSILLLYTSFLLCQRIILYRWFQISNETRSFTKKTDFIRLRNGINRKST